jgi:hypothetical protein
MFTGRVGSALAVMFLYQCAKLRPGKMLKQLIEQAGYLYDCLALLVGEVWRSSAQGAIRQYSLQEAFFFSSSHSRTCLGQECKWLTALTP